MTTDTAPETRHPVVKGPHGDALAKSRRSAGLPIGEQFRVGFTIQHPTCGMQRTVSGLVTDLVPINDQWFIFRADLYPGARNIRCVVSGARFVFDSHERLGVVLLPEDFIQSRVRVRH